MRIKLSKVGPGLQGFHLAVFGLLLLIGTISVFVPFAWMILTSFKTFGESISINPVVIFPERIRWDAYVTVTNLFNFWRLYFNTISFMVLRIIIAALITAPMAAYALARLKFYGKSLFFALILVQLMVPSQIFVIPQYLMVLRLGALNTMFALVFPGLITTFGTFLLRQFFMSIPASIEESAKIDGANPLQIYFKVMLPMVKSGLVAVSIFTALFAFRELLWPLVVITNVNQMPLSAALARLQGQAMTFFPDIMAAATLASIPMVAVYVMFQRWFIQGIATSGLKY